MASFTFAQIQELVPNLDLADQVQFAKLKGVEVPQDVMEMVAAELAIAEAAKRLEEHVVFTTSPKQPDRAYLKTKGFALTAPTEGKSKFAQGLYLETRAIDEALAVLTRAREVCQAKGIPTGPTTEELNPGHNMFAGK